jgi:hypothetical protein
MSDWMSNLYLINTILNIISTTFTLLFLLYRFTSLFSYIIGFVKFCGKLFNGIVYLKNTAYDYYYNRTGHINEDIEHGLSDSNDDYYSSDGVIYRSMHSNDSFFSKCKRKIYNMYNYLYPKKSEYNIIPIYQTRSSYIIDNDNDNSDLNDHQIEQNIINQQINTLLDEENDDDSISAVPLLGFNQQSDVNSYNISNHYDPLGNYMVPSQNVNYVSNQSANYPGDLNSAYNNYFNKQFNNSDRPFNNDRIPFSNSDRPFNNSDRPFNNSDRPFNNDDRPFNNSDRPFSNDRIPFNNDDINWYNTIDTTPAFVKPNNNEINLNETSEYSESDYKSDYKSDYSNSRMSNSQTSNSDAIDLIHKFQNLSLKLN